MDNRAYWLWLQHAFGAGSRKPAVILHRMHSVQAFYEAGHSFWQTCHYITEKEYYALTSYLPERALPLLEYYEKVGQQVLTPDDAAYPERLRQLRDFPCALYVRGNLPPVDQILSIAVVGSRKADTVAIEAARRISAELAARGVVIVSGGAVGIDSAAHNGALRAGGKTICVLPCGLDYPYLMDNAAMRERIAETGALVTEYPENAGVFRGTFAVRNRLISGLASGVLVVSAAKKSGTLITAACATEQNRDIFVVPGPAGDERWAGAAALIEDGACAVETAEDILREYAARIENFPQTLAPEMEKNSSFSEKTRPEMQKNGPKNGISLKTGENYLDELSSDAVTLWQVLCAQPRHINELTAASALPAHRVLAALTELELTGLCESLAGGFYRAAHGAKP